MRGAPGGIPAGRLARSVGAETKCEGVEVISGREETGRSTGSPHHVDGALHLGHVVDVVERANADGMEASFDVGADGDAPGLW